MKPGTNVTINTDKIGRALRTALGWSIDQQVAGVVTERQGKRLGVRVNGDVLWFDADCVERAKPCAS